MKKIFSIFAAVLFAGSMFAAQAVVDYANAGYPNATSLDEVAVTSGVVSVTLTKGGGSTAPAYYDAGTGARTYGGNTMTISAGANLITSIVFDFSQNNKDYSVSAGSYSKAESTWTGSANSVVFSTESGSGHNRIKSITVTYTAGQEIDATAIELNKNTLTLQEGENETLTATLTPANATTAVEWASSNAEVATVSASGKVTAVAAGTATITASAGEGVSATCAVTVEAAPAITCAEASALAKDEIAKLNEVVVTYANGSNIYVKDASGYALIYQYNYGLKAGDIVNGFIGKSSPYNGLPELIPTVEYAALEVTEGAAPDPEEIKAAPTNADINKYLIIKGVSVEGEFTTASATNLDATIGEETFVLRNNFKVAQTFEAGKKYDIIGVGSIYVKNDNTTLQLYFISATEHQDTPSAVENVAVEMKATKIVRDGQLYIIRDGVMFNANGAAVK